MGFVPRAPTEKQRRIADLLKPVLSLPDGELLPYGIFSKIARQARCTPAYVTVIYNRLRGR